MEKITEISGPVHNEKFWIGDNWLAYLYLVISSFSVIHFFHYYLYFVYICVVCPCVYAVPTEASRGHQSLGLELQKVVCLYVGAWNWTITNMDINAQTILIWEANIFSLWGKMCMNYTTISRKFIISEFQKTDQFFGHKFLKEGRRREGQTKNIKQMKAL